MTTFNIRTLRRAIAAAAFIGLAAQSSWAVTLNTPVSSFADTTLPGTTELARPELAGLVLADDLQAFSFDGITGTVQNRVVREFGSGTLDFYWKVDTTSSSSGPGVTALRLDTFGVSNLTDADWRIDGLGTVAPTIGRLFNASTYPLGDINFLFGSTGVTAGTESRFFFLHTTATDFAKTARYDLLDSSDQISSIYSTYAPVPEPTSLALLIGGLAVCGTLAQRRRTR